MAKDDLKDEWGYWFAMPERVIEMWREIGMSAIGLFVYLRYRTNRDRGCAWPSYDDIEESTGMSGHTIAKSIKILEDHGLLERKKRYGASTVYVLKRPDEPPDMAVSSNAPSALMEGDPVMHLVQDSNAPSALMEGDPVMHLVQDSNAPSAPSVVHLVQGIQDLNIQDLNTQDLKGSRSQNLWLHVLSIISNDYYRYNPLGPRCPDFLTYWQPTELLEETPLTLKIACIGEDPEFQSQWLAERSKLVEQAIIGILGKKLEVEFVYKNAASE